MTEVAFHFNLADKLGYTCRLLRKMAGRGVEAVVVAEEQDLATLDTLLWTFSPLDFVPHCRAQARDHVLALTPTVLTASLDAMAARAGHAPTVVNLAPGVPQGFEKFERLIELVGGDDEDRAAARQRWKHYKDRGYAITRHDLASSEAGHAA